MKVLSLFDGMACGMLAMQGAGIKVERYVAFEIDKYAVQTASHNFPMIEQRGDVFAANFTEFEGFDFLVGGSPCTYWSIAQKNNRETEASGMGWELFSQYVRALHEAKPRYFIYENNKSMSNAIRESITKAFGFEPICINSALVSAQNRQRLYWVGKREADGTYSKVDIQQPEDRGIFVKDILDGVTDREKARCVMASVARPPPREYFCKRQGTLAFEPVDQTDDAGAYCFNETQNGKSYCLDAHYWKTPGSPGVFLEKKHARGNRTMVAERVSTVLNVNPSGNGLNGAVGRIDAKARCLTTNKGEGPKVIVPVCVAERGRYTADGSIEQRFEAREDGKTNVLTTVQKDNNVCEPVYVGELPEHNGKYRNGKQPSQQYRVYSADGKSVACDSDSRKWYAIAVEFDGERPTKAMSGADGKVYPVYEVRDGFITIKEKTYPIKLPDGFYIIRKLTVRECKRLQTVPDFYEFPVSDAQAYKLLGNGWTVYVIVHLAKGCVSA